MNNEGIFSNCRLLIMSILIFTLVIGCNDETVSPDNNGEKETYNYDDLIFSDKIELFNYPTFGSMATNFKFNITLKDSTLKVSKIKYDFTHNNEYDAVLTDFDTVNTNFKLLGYNTIIATVELVDKSVLSCSTIVWLTEPTVISSDNNAYFEPNIYNGHMISVTHGQGHTAQIIDLKTLEMNCYFCGFASDAFNEMHCSIPSFDGTKLLFSNGANHRFSYYDFAKNDSTRTDLPITPPGYPIGQLTWSLDSKSIYYVSMNDNLQSSGVKSYNLESNQINSLYNSGEFICVIPDQEDKIAILEYVGHSKSKLIIYNITSNTVEKEYTDIPLNAPFRMLRDSDRVYFDGELAFYSLSRKKIFHMQFDELDLSGHMYGESDITMDGDKFIIGSWHDYRTLYSIILPNYF